MLTKKFLLDLVERAIGAGAAAGAAVLATSGVGSWREASMASGGAILLTALKALGATRVGDPDTASALPRKDT